MPTFSSLSGTTSTSTVSQAETAIISLLFGILIAHITAWLIFSLSTIYKKRKYLQYSGGDVEIREDL